MWVYFKGSPLKGRDVPYPDMKSEEASVGFLAFVVTMMIDYMKPIKVLPQIPYEDLVDIWRKGGADGSEGKD